MIKEMVRALIYIKMKIDMKAIGKMI